MLQNYHKMVLYGAGGHAKVVYDCLVSRGESLVGVFDDDGDINKFLGHPVSHSYSSELFKKEKFLICIGNNKTREKISSLVKHEFGVAIHRAALIGGNAVINSGSVIFANSAIQPESVIGNHVIINTGAIVEHECTIGDFVHVGPGAVICGDVNIGTGTLIGANVTILPGTNIGKWVTIGAGSVILEDVVNGATVVGNPGKRIDK